jgi:hypothetical protein
MIATVILNDNIWRIEIAFGTDLRTLEEGWRVERLARVEGLGMAYAHVSDKERFETREEALADGMRMVAYREGIDD